MLEKLLELGRDVEFKIDVDVWKFQLMRPAEKLKRAQAISRLLGGVPIESVTNDDYNRAFRIATLAVAYLEGPQTFVEKCSRDFAMLDDEYVGLLFNEYAKYEEKFENAKKKFRPAQGSEKA